MENNRHIQPEGVGNENKRRLSPKEILHKYISYFPLFLVSIVIMLTVGYLKVRYTVNQYTSKVYLLIKDDKRNVRTSASNDLQDIFAFNKYSNLANETEQLKSTSLIEKVVTSLNLNAVHKVEGKIKKQEWYRPTDYSVDIISIKDSLRPFRFDWTYSGNRRFKIASKEKTYTSGEIIQLANATIRINITADKHLNKEDKYEFTWLPTTQTVHNILAALTVKQLSKEASILNITINTESAERGRNILDKLVEEYNYRNVEYKNKGLDNTINFIEDRLSTLTSELGNVEKGLQNYRQRNEVIDLPLQNNVDYNAMKKLDEGIIQNEVSIRIIKMIEDYVSSPGRKYSLVPSSLTISDLTLNKLIAEFNDLQLERESKLRSMPVGNPTIMTMENQIEKLRTSILENLRNVTKSYDMQKQQMLTEFAQIKSRLSAVPGKEREVLEISRQQGIKQNLFLFLLQKREEAAINKSVVMASAESIDPASTSGLPVLLSGKQIMLIAFLIGIIIPIVIIYIKDLMNDKLTMREDIVANTSAPVIGEISHHPNQNRVFVVGKKDRNIISEQFRIVRTNLQFLTSNKRSPVLMVTSSVAGEGKTFCSMNIGAVWSLAGKKTVILELDLRKPKVSKSLNISRDNGISNYVFGNVKKEDLAIPVPGMDNLYIIPAGPIPPNPSEVLMDEKMDQLFEYLRNEFDFIVIDTAPVGLVSDARILARVADATTYIIRQRYTTKKQMGNIEDLHSKKMLPNMGIVVNDVKIGGVNSYYGYGGVYGSGYGYGYGGSYGYHYHYGYGYGEKPPNFLKKVKRRVLGS